MRRFALNGESPSSQRLNIQAWAVMKLASAVPGRNMAALVVRIFPMDHTLVKSTVYSFKFETEGR